MLSTIRSLGLLGIEPFPVSVEVGLTRAIPVFEVVGLPDAAVRESRERVRSAIGAAGFPFPEGRIVVNLAPADVRKAGSLYDLPILVGMLRAQELLPDWEEESVFLGELSLSGELRRVSGVLPMLLGAAELGVRRAFIPFGNAAEASAVRGLAVYAVHDVTELVAFLRGEGELSPVTAPPAGSRPAAPRPDLREVKGQRAAKRALEVAAAGGHNLLFIGSPGAGKSMLAKRLPSILPAMTEAEAVETTKVYSACGQLPPGLPLITERPLSLIHI